MGNLISYNYNIIVEKSYKKIAVEAALESGRFIKRSVGRIKQISFKGRINLVTDVDKKAEGIVIRKILSAFPDHSILSEESLPREGASEFKWIIDPLDGTTNFAHSFPFFAVSIGLEKKGGLVLGVVYDPIRNELFYAERKKGAYLNGSPIHVSRTAKLKDALVATGFAYGLKKIGDNIDNFKKMLMLTRAVRRPGSAALDFCYTACGRIDGFWELYLHPWDCAAGALIIKEAGGMITKMDGSEYSHYDKEVLATNGIIHKKMVKALIL
jgi:myo-inositol-1(or 4)-monophosphatase